MTKHPTRKLIIVLFSVALVSVVMYSCKKETTPTVSPELKAKLGRSLFFDKGLSNPGGQACASCHSPNTGFSDPNHNITSTGAMDGLFGNRNAPSITYSMFAPTFHFDNVDSSYVGGLFLDGRVNTLEEQAQKPFLNVLEMNNADASMVAAKLQRSGSYSLFLQVYGKVEDPDKVLAKMAEAIAAFERTSELNPFTSKFDAYLKGQASLTTEELSGMRLFTDTLKGKCANCHLITPDDASGQVLFTDFTYNNDGVPKNTRNPFYNLTTAFNPAGIGYMDYGLGAIVNDHAYDGAFKVPTLRNIAISAPYFHNGAFNTLEEAVHFYNTRDVAGSGFATPEIVPTVDHEETGDLRLTAKEESDIVAFLKTLTDGYQ